ncbi:phosphoenolpyruvate synthase [Thermoactinomyces mirandus]|nr:phosphoenolpyruvate synthase [Thermoactinomyces mirandus]
MNYILHFNQIDRKSIPLVGGKGANLGELARAGFPVPPGFCVTTVAYRQWIDANREMEQWFDQLKHLKPEQLDEIRRTGEKIREQILDVPFPDLIKAEIVEAWKELGKDYAYAVRSSATAEDLPTASFAGQQETFLNVKGEMPLIEAVKKCWASLFTDRAILYRAKNGLDHRSVSMSVVIQRMILPERSGIMFTLDPVAGHRHTVSIDAGFGLGEALVSGIVSADLYKVRNNGIVHRQIAKKEKGIFPVAEGGTETRELPPELQEEQVLPDEKILELAAIGRKIEKHYGSAQDIEWGMEGKQIYILQSRPVTSAFPVPPAKDNNYRIYLSLGHKQMMTDYMKPLGISVMRTLVPLDKSSACDESQAYVEAGGRLYLDCSEVMYSKFVRRKLSQVTMPDDDLSALKKAVLREGFEKRIPKKRMTRQTFRIWKLILDLYGRLLPRLIRMMVFEDPVMVYKRVNSAFEQELSRLQQSVDQRSGAERIRYVQEHVGGKLFFSLLDSLACTFVGIIARSKIERLVKKWLGEELSASIHKSPPGNVTSEMGLLIGDLADIARDYPEVANYLERANDSTFYKGLREVEGGDVFKAELDRFMEKFGMRAQGEIDITRVRYKEAPTILVPSILSHMRSNNPNEHREKFEQGAKEANEAIQNLLTRVRKTKGARKAKKLSHLVHLYRNMTGTRELPKYMIIRYFGVYRDAFLEEEKVLCSKKIIDHKEDIFYLTFNEIIALMENRLHTDVKKLIRSRKQLEMHYQKLIPPRVMTSDGEIFTAERSNTEAPPGALIGIPVSAGVAEGFVKVVRRLEEGSLGKGDILVAPYTDPGWTPLFHSAKALVTEIGGTMTHGAVVAREYGIPAVCGVENATKILKDGQYVRVEGTKGYVKILDKKNESVC